MRFGRSYALVKQVTRKRPLEVWVRIGTYTISCETYS